MEEKTSKYVVISISRLNCMASTLMNKKVRRGVLFNFQRVKGFFLVRDSNIATLDLNILYYTLDLDPSFCLCTLQ